MGATPKISHYLIHQETGQRYAVGEDVVVGRSHGDIVFPDDPKLSSQHCRILRTTAGLGVHDLGSSNGTYVDGIKLDPEKVYSFKSGSLLNVGEQAFKLQEANVSRKVPARKKKRSRKKKSNWDSVSILAGIGVVAATLFFTHIFLDKGRGKAEPKLEMLSPFQLMEKEMKAALNEYKELGRAKEAGELSDKGLANSIRKFLLPRLTAVHEKLGAIKPAGEFEKRKLAADKKLVMALIEQLTAMAFHAETKSKKYEKDLDRLSEVAAAAAKEVQELEAPRKPTSAYDSY